MILRIFDAITRRWAPKRVGPGFFAWSIFGRIGLSLRWDDDGRQPGDNPPLPCDMHVFVVGGEVFLHTAHTDTGPQPVRIYVNELGDGVAVYHLRAGERMRVYAGDPLRVELARLEGNVHEVTEYPWCDRPVFTNKKIAKMIVFRS